MPGTIQLSVLGRVDLDGSHRATVETVSDEDAALLGPVDGRPAFAILRAGDRSCTVIVSEVARGRAGRISVDRYKAWHLGVRDGETVTVEPVRPAPALRVDLHAPASFPRADSVRFIGKPLVTGEKTAVFTFSGEARPVTVTATAPPGHVVVTPATDVRISSVQAGEIPVTWKDIGGLGREVGRVRETIEYSLKYPDLFRTLGVSQPRGIILHGPPGTGKTLIARALAGEVGARFYSISGPEIYSKWYGKSEENLRNVFDDAVRNAPSIVVIDELDALVPARDRTHGDQEQRIVATFLTQMDGLREMRDVVVVGTTNRLDAIDPALRRGGRFEHEIHVGVPDAAGRREILSIHTRRMPLDGSVDLDEIAQKTVGFVGADLAMLSREAAYCALRRVLPPGSLEAGSPPPAAAGDIRVGRADFLGALKTVPPSGLKEFAIEIPRAGWQDVGGLDHVKRILVENIALAAVRREAFRKAGIRPARGILLHGPPGTGKTLLARAVAGECGANFISIKGPEIRSRWLGESEARIRLAFTKARQVAPCVVFLDEIEAAVPARGMDPHGSMDGIVDQILAEMDGIDSGEGVWVIGATNRIDRLDPAVLRPGRFDLIVEIPLPDAAARRSILGIHLAGKALAADVDLDAFAIVTEGFSGAEIAEACRSAAWEALRESAFDAERLEIGSRHLETSVHGLRGRPGAKGGRP